MELIKEGRRYASEPKFVFIYPKLNLTFIASLILSLFLLCLGLFYQVPPL